MVYIHLKNTECKIFTWLNCTCHLLGSTSVVAAGSNGIKIAVIMSDRCYLGGSSVYMIGRLSF